jgi:hypothetical protein
MGLATVKAVLHFWCGVPPGMRATSSREKVNWPVETGNAAAKVGKLGATIASILGDLKPEAVYFTATNGLHPIDEGRCHESPGADT